MTGSKTKGSIIYKTDPDAKAKVLEAFLFGASKSDPGSLFELKDDEESIADMLRKVRSRMAATAHPMQLHVNHTHSHLTSFMGCFPESLWSRWHVL